jgi:NAD(P)H dehydrogenase (quinone)
MIIITAATGKLGHHVVDALLERVPASQIAVAVRNVDRAADLAARGVQVRHADYERPETLRAAFAGAHKLLLISSSEVGRRESQHRAAVAAAVEAGVGFLAYTSILRADRSTLGLAAEHVATERAIAASGLPHAFLRNGWYLENYSENLASALAHGVMLGAAGDGRIAAAARRDLAEAAAAVLLGEGHENRTYELAGDARFTMRELAAIVSELAHRPVVYQDLPQTAYRDALIGFGVPAPFAEVLADSDAGIARGELDDTTGDLRRLIGRPTTSPRAAVAAALSASA